MQIFEYFTEYANLFAIKVIEHNSMEKINIFNDSELTFTENIFRGIRYISIDACVQLRID